MMALSPTSRAEAAWKSKSNEPVRFTDITTATGGLSRKEWLVRHEKSQGTLLSIPYTG
jgi:hypothetical protein